MIEPVIIGGCELYHGDNRDVLRQLPDNSIDSVVTDPPYALVSIVKRFANSPRNERTENAATPYGRTGRGFMGCRWDTGEVAFSEEFWAEVLRVLKPGGHVAAFGASRGYHRMACAIEDAGFEIRDSLVWMYATGFPKSHNVSNNEKFCQCEAEQASERNVRQMWNSDVSEAINVGDECRKILQQGVPQQDAHGIRPQKEAGRGAPYDGCKESILEGRSYVSAPQGQLCASEICSLPSGFANDGAIGRLRDGAPTSYGEAHWPNAHPDGMRASSGPQAAEQHRVEPRTLARQSIAQDGGAWKDCGRCGKPMVPTGLGTALKPAFEPIVLARKPLSEKTVAANVLRWGTGALNIGACRVPTEAGVDLGRNNNARKQEDGTSYVVQKATMRVDNSGGQRWPANVVHDGSDEVVGAFPDSKSTPFRANDVDTAIHGGGIKHRSAGGFSDSGSAARFFYSAKASKKDRDEGLDSLPSLARPTMGNGIGGQPDQQKANNKNTHPTVKPTSLMQWLCRLITPPGGTVLDPFMGSGSTGKAAVYEGFKFVGCEREDEYIRIAEARIAYAVNTPTVAAAVAAQQPEAANDNEPQQVDLFGKAA